MARFVYVMAKNHHQDDPQSQNPAGIDKGDDFRNATSKFR